MLEPLRSAIYAFKTDFVVAGWIARLKPSESRRRRRDCGRRLPETDDPRFRRQADRHQGVTQPIDVLMDLEPRSDETKALPGRGYDHHSVSGPCWRGGGEKSRWRRHRFLCCGRTGRSASSWPRPFCRKHDQACRLRHLFLRTGAADADQRRPVAVFGGAEGPARRRDEYVANDQGVVALRAVKRAVRRRRWCGR